MNNRHSLVEAALMLQEQIDAVNPWTTGRMDFK